MTAILALADGTIFSGKAIGAPGTTVGEVVFNTAMTGYQEVLTDPSYANQIVTFTCPHIGNTGINLADNESNIIWAAGVVIRELSPIVSNWRAMQTFTSWLQQQNIVAISGIDTRMLTKHIREHGGQNGCIITGITAVTQAIRNAKNFPVVTSKDLLPMVTTKKTYLFKSARQLAAIRKRKTTPQLLRTHLVPIEQQEQKSVAAELLQLVVVDFGVKRSILIQLAASNCSVIVVPCYAKVTEILQYQPDGIVLSNGPGDPNTATEYLASIKQLLAVTNVPLLGICLGFQLLALAFGAKVVKLKFGHHGINHPVKELISGKVIVTSQNHNYAVAQEQYPKELLITHCSLFDGTIQGLRHRKRPIYGYQWHPEASPGPHDSRHYLQQFIQVIQNRNQHAKMF